MVDSTEPGVKPSTEAQSPQPSQEVVKKPTPIETVQKLRADALGGKTSIEDIAAFENSLAGRALSMAEGFLKTSDALSQYPDVKRFMVGSDPHTDRDGSFSFDVGRQFRVIVRQDGVMEFKPPFNGGDDSFLYGAEADPGARLGVDIDIKTGEATSMIRGQRQVLTDETEGRMTELISVTRGYYDRVQSDVPEAAYELSRRRQPAGLMTFPSAEINNIRHGTPAETPAQPSGGIKSRLATELRR
jgi:hypothetical protein